MIQRLSKYDKRLFKFDSETIQFSSNKHLFFSKIAIKDTERKAMISDILTEKLVT